MLQRHRAGNGVVYYRSPLLADAGIRHAFSTRIGGVSPAPFASLNLGNPPGDTRDDEQNIAQNYARLASAIECGNCARRSVHQVHGACTLDADAPSFQNQLPADALVSTDSTSLLAVRTADCVPVLLSTADGRAVAAVHAGWRGVIAEIVVVATHALVTKARCSTGDVRAAIGPCIGAEAFEVGAEVADAFSKRFGEDATVIRREWEKGRIDLRRAVARQLFGIGVARNHIDTTDRCTVMHADEFYSHRRDNGVTGRMAALIAPSRA